MSASLTAFLESWERQLQRLPGVMTRVAPRVAAEFSDLARTAFESRRSVYGAPFTSPTQGAIDLRESGALGSRATRYTASGTTVRASVASVRYARYQLKHGFLPAKGRLPQAWKDRIEAIIAEEIDREMAKVGGR